MTSEERKVLALQKQKPDRLPVILHQWPTCHLQKFTDGMSELEAFVFCGMDATVTFGKDINLQTPQWRVSTTTQATPKRHGDTMSNRNAGRHAHGQRGRRRSYRVGGGAPD